MDPIPVGVLAAVVAVLAIGLGIGIDRFLLRKHSIGHLEAARADADRLRRENKKELEEEISRRRGEFESDLTQRRTEFEQQLAESSKQLRRGRNKLEKRQTGSA